MFCLTATARSVDYPALLRLTGRGRLPAAALGLLRPGAQNVLACSLLRQFHSLIQKRLQDILDEHGACARLIALSAEPEKGKDGEPMIRFEVTLGELDIAAMAELLLPLLPDLAEKNEKLRFPAELAQTDGELLLSALRAGLAAVPREKQEEIAARCVTAYGPLIRKKAGEKLKEKGLSLELEEISARALPDEAEPEATA